MVWTRGSTDDDDDDDGSGGRQRARLSQPVSQSVWLFPTLCVCVHRRFCHSDWRVAFLVVVVVVVGDKEKKSGSFDGSRSHKTTKIGHARHEAQMETDKPTSRDETGGIVRNIIRFGSSSITFSATTKTTTATATTMELRQTEQDVSTLVGLYGSLRVASIQDFQRGTDDSRDNALAEQLSSLPELQQPQTAGNNSSSTSNGDPPSSTSVVVLDTLEAVQQTLETLRNKSVALEGKIGKFRKRLAEVSV